MISFGVGAYIGTKGLNMIAMTEIQVAETKPFRAFEIQRVTQLVRAGMQVEKARLFARRETLSRARASLSHGIDQALRAELQLIEEPGQPDVRFQLAYPPLP